MATYNGTSGNDTATYFFTNDTMYGGAGNDSLNAGDGVDLLYGGTGNDTLDGGNWNDTVSGELGNDSIFGGSGSDNLTGGQGKDTIYGGNENDVILADGQFLNIANWASTSTGSAVNLTIVNSADGPIDLYFVDASATQVYYATIGAGQTYVQSTFVGHNWVLKDLNGYFLETISGTAAQTITYGPDLADVISGGLGDDDIRAQYGSDLIYGDGGSDTIHGESGNDTAFGGDGNDLFYGGDGNDSFGDWSTDGGDDTVYGGDGNDTLIGAGESDQIYGDAGDDYLSGGIGTDSIYGGTGNDVFWLTEDHQVDYFFGGEEGGDTDWIDFGNWLSTDGVKVIYTGPDAGTYGYTGSSSASGSFVGIEGVVGTDYADTINGALNTSFMQVRGGGGADVLTGGSANDTLDGGSGADTVTGGDGNDLIFGGTESGVVQGLTNGNFSSGTAGWTETGSGVFTGGGYLFEANSTSGTLTHNAPVSGLQTGPGTNGAGQITFGLAWSDSSPASTTGVTTVEVRINGVTYATIATPNGDGTQAAITYANGASGPVSTVAETSAYTGPVTTVTINLPASVPDTGTLTFYTTAAGADDVFISNFSLLVTDSIAAGSDSLDGGLGNDTLFGGEGNDTLTGGAGNDALTGDAGADSLLGGDGADLFFGGAGDTVVGGEGGTDNDTLVLDLADLDSVTYDIGNTEAGIVTFTAASGGGTLTFSEIENLQYTGVVDGTSGNDSIAAGYVDAQGDAVDGGDGDTDTILAGAGNDLVNSLAGDDLIFGGDGADTLVGNSGVDTVYGGDGNDFVIGGIDTGNESGLGPFSGNGDAATDGDVLYGGAGDDLVDGDAGNDTLDGGIGNDTLHGGGSEDLVSGDAGTDIFYGGAGNDTLFGGEDDDTAFAGTGNDLVYGEAGADLIAGDGADDTLFGGDGADTFFGGAGNDSIAGGGDEDTFFVNPGDGDDTVQGGETGTDFDTLVVEVGSVVTYGGGSNEAGTIARASGGTVTFTEIESIQFAGAVDGTAGDDSIVGGYVDAQGDAIDGADGDPDVVMAGDGNDAVIAGAGNDTVFGGTGNDSLNGGVGDDSIDGGSGADQIYGGSENDLIHGDNGADNIFGGTEDDTLFGGADNDTLAGAAGNDLLYGDDANDSLLGGFGNDTLYGGQGDDTLLGGEDNDTVYGGDGNDHVVMNPGDDRLDGGDGTDMAVFSGDVTDYSFDHDPSGALIVTDSVAARDGTDSLSGFEYVTFGGTTYHLVTGDDGTNTTLQGPGDGTPSLIIAHDGDDWGGGHATSDVIFGGAGVDTLDGGDGHDTLLGEDGNDLLRGDGGNDLAFGGAGEDTLEGGLGDDLLDGGADSDRLSGGDGSDSLTGGSGNDTFVLMQGGDADTVADFDMTLSAGRTADQLDVSDLRTPGGDPIKWRDVVVTDTVGDGSGDAVLTFPSGESIVLQGVAPTAIDSKQEMASAGIPCFTLGTLIDTAIGPVPVERLRPGDLVRTLDHGYQPIRWAGCRALDAGDLGAHPNLRPVIIRKGALGNSRRMCVSPQHAFLLNGRLIRAKHLAQSRGGKVARVDHKAQAVTYVHILFDRHEIIFAEGAATESLYPGPMALRGLDLAALAELLTLFPQLATGLGQAGATAAIYGSPARRYEKPGRQKNGDAGLNRKARLPLFPANDRHDCPTKPTRAAATRHG